MPEGSIGKEGPIAGSARIVPSFTKTRVNPDIAAFRPFFFIAMTGKISRVGQVLPVGGLEEKILAVNAHRPGIKAILAPAGSQADIEENLAESFVYMKCR